MAKIWPVYEGRESTRGGPWAEIPVLEAVSLFELRREDFLNELKTTPRFGEVDDDLWYLGFKHIVVEIGRNEGRREKWKPGFYRSRVKPEKAFSRLIEQPLLAGLGPENVVRVEHEPSTDSQDRDALKITVVISPNATKAFTDETALNALIQLKERLRQMRDDRTPIIEYATEAELAQDGGS